MTSAPVDAYAAKTAEERWEMRISQALSLIKARGDRLADFQLEADRELFGLTDEAARAFAEDPGLFKTKDQESD